MSISSDLVRVYTGTKVEGLYIKAMLEENGIGVFDKDTLEESVIAGWVNGSTEDEMLLFVSPENADKAKALIEDYFKSRNGK